MAPLIGGRPASELQTVGVVEQPTTSRRTKGRRPEIVLGPQTAMPPMPAPVGKLAKSLRRVPSLLARGLEPPRYAQYMTRVLGSPELRAQAAASAYTEALLFFAGADLGGTTSPIKYEETDAGCCLSFCRISLSKDLQQEREHIFAIARTALDSKEPAHVALMLGLFSALDGEVVPAGRMEGPHWERIGFQGSQPGTDLRGVGMLGVLQPLFLARERPEFVQAAITYYRGLVGEPPGPTDFPFMVISLNLTQVTLVALRTGALNRLLRERKSGGVTGVVHTLYCALMVACFSAWEERGLGVEDFGPLRASLEQEARLRPKRLILSFERESWELREAASSVLNPHDEAL